MHHVFTSFASLLGGQELILLTTIILVLSVPIIGFVLIFNFRHQKEKLWHETARLALEKGQPVPPRGPAAAAEEIPPGARPDDWYRWKRERRRQKDIRHRIILVAIGAALLLGNGYNHNFYNGMSMGAFIMLGLGLASLLNAQWGRSDDDFRPPSA
jgi:hypothetical protein